MAFFIIAKDKKEASTIPLQYSYPSRESAEKVIEESLADPFYLKQLKIFESKDGKIK